MCRWWHLRAFWECWSVVVVHPKSVSVTDWHALQWSGVYRVERV